MNSSATRSSPGAERIEARFGLRVGALLNQQAQRTPHDISERLRIAREQALVRARASRAAGSSADLTVGAGPTAILGRQPSWLFRFASIVPLVLLVAGMVLIDEWHDRAQIEAAADVDVALLADDLPPDAYSDAGFVEFLKEGPQ
jgi:Protein of unknown function (DUF3619)